MSRILNIGKFSLKRGIFPWQVMLGEVYLKILIFFKSFDLEIPTIDNWAEGHVESLLFSSIFGFWFNKVLGVVIVHMKFEIWGETDIGDQEELENENKLWEWE